MKLYFIFALLLISACGEHHAVLDINYSAAYIVNGGGNNVQVMNLATEQITSTIALPDATFPHHIYVNPAKTQLAVAITATDLSAGHGGHKRSVAYKVQVLNAKTGELEKELPLPLLPHNAVFSHDGTSLWISQQDAATSKLLVYQVSDWALLSTINVGRGLSEITFSADGTKAYAANTSDNSITIIDAHTKAIVKNLSVGITPVAAWPASNGRMYVDNEGGQSITEIDVATNQISSTLSLGFKPAFVAYNALQQELWVSDATNGKVVWFKQVTGNWVKQGEVATGADAHAIVFSGNQMKAYVTNQGGNTLSVLNTATHTVSKNLNVGAKPNGIALIER